MNSLRSWNALSLGFVISLGLASSFLPQGCGGGDGPPVAAKLPGADGGTVATAKYTLSLTLDEAGLKVDAIDPYEEMRQTAHASGPWDPDALLWYIEGADGTTLAGGMIEDPRVGYMMDHEEGATTQVGGRTNSASFKLDVPVNTGTIKIYQLAPSGVREGGCNPGGLPLGSSGLGGVGGSGSVDPGSMPGLSKIVDNGNCKANINLLIVGDGYQQAELGTFRTKAAQMVAGIKSYNSMTAHWKRINVWTLEVASKDSGIDDPDNKIEKDTMFDMSLGEGDMRRCTMPKHRRAEGMDLIAKAKKASGAENVVILANSSEYGGCAGDIIGMTPSSRSPQVLIHELGHLLVDLDDEYVEAAQCNPGSAYRGGINVTRNKNNPPWKAIINSAVEGAHYCATGEYRPTADCMMNTTNVDFCVVCRDALDKYFTRRDVLYGDGCKAPEPPKNCFEGGDACTGGTVCAWNGTAAGYCCKAPFQGTETCTTDAECKGGICSFGGPPKNFFYCTTADANACKK